MLRDLFFLNNFFFFLILKGRMQCSLTGSFRVLKQIGLALNFTKSTSKHTWAFFFFFHLCCPLFNPKGVDRWMINFIGTWCNITGCVLLTITFGSMHIAASNNFPGEKQMQSFFLNSLEAEDQHSSFFILFSLLKFNIILSKTW